jgi:hypothetical protein
MIFRDAPIIVWAATILHVVIAVLLLSSTAASGSTGPAEVTRWLGRNPAAVAMLLSSGLALFAMTRKHSDGWAIVGFLLPQQALLYVAALGGVEAVLDGQYADGVQRPYEFILTDQLWMVAFAVIHTFAMLELRWKAP